MSFLVYSGVQRSRYLFLFLHSERKQDSLSEHRLTDGDRIHIVRTMATMMMVHVQRPALKDCLMVSKALYKKYHFLGDADSEVLYCLVFKRNRQHNYFLLFPNRPCALKTRLYCIRKALSIHKVHLRIIIPFVIATERMEVVLVQQGAECEPPM